MKLSRCSRAVLAAGVLLAASRATGHEPSTLRAALERSTPLFASPQLADVTSLSSPGHFDKYPSAGFDRAGRLWVAYTSMQADRDRIVVRSRDRHGWSAPETLATGEGNESGAQFAFDGQGRPWVFWHGRRAGGWAVYARRHEAGRWGAERRVSPAGIDTLHPVAVADATGRLWVAWEVAGRGRFSLQLVAQQGNAFSTPLDLASDGSDRRPALASAPDGGVWLAWDSTRAGNYDVWLARARAGAHGQPRLQLPQPVTRDAGIDDSPSLACARDGTLWVAWNSMRGHRGETLRSDRHSGDAFVRAYRDGVWLAPPSPWPGALPGQVSFGLKNKTPRDAVEPYWHWKATQNYPHVFVDGAGRAWILWRTDATGAHNFDLWARVHDGASWSAELQLTTFSPGRDEFPSAAMAPDGSLRLAWQAQALPAPGEEARSQGGDVDAYNTLGNPNVVLTGRLVPPTENYAPAPIGPTPEEAFRADEIGEPQTPGPAPRTARSADGRYGIFFGDPHSHSILSDAKTGLPDQLLVLSRDPLGLDFAVVSDHTEMGRLQPTERAEIQLTARTFTDAGRFVSLSGWEWTAGPAYGHRVILHPDDGGPVLSWTSPEGDTIEKLYAFVRQHPGMMSPHHTANATWGRWNPGATFDEVLEPNFEIASWHGRFEYYGNPHEGRRQVPGHQYQDALRLGRHVGVMAASDTHHLSPGEGGLTAVLAERLDRESIYDAVRSRRNYATSGPRIVLEFTANGAPMGSRIESAASIQMSVRVLGTALLDHVEIVRNQVDSFAAVRIEQNPEGRDGVFLLYDPAQPQGDRRVARDDMSRLTFSMSDEPPLSGETSYYVRVTQADGHQAWSSPIWVRRPAP